MSFGVIVLMPRSRATTVYSLSPEASTVYGSVTVTSPTRLAPSISGDSSTFASRTSGSRISVEMPTRIAPRSRRWRVSARVSMSQMPTTDCARSSSSSDLTERQFEGIRAGSRTT
jgi:hypothetical protein